MIVEFGHPVRCKHQLCAIEKSLLAALEIVTLTKEDCHGPATLETDKWSASKLLQQQLRKHYRCSRLLCLMLYLCVHRQWKQLTAA